MALRRIGFYGGTFDPIHFGHLNLAVNLMEAQNLDEVWLCPAWINPHKQGDNTAPALHRLKMVQLAIEGVAGFKVIEDEIVRQGASYTVETLRRLKAENPDVEFYLLLGDDTALHFFDWKEPQAILELATPLVGSRDEVIPSRLGISVATPLFDISATDIRKRLSQNKFCGHLLPQKVIDYIGENALY